MLLEEKDKFKDSFSKFAVTLFEEFDFDTALKECANMKKEAEGDLLLKEFAAEI